MKKKFYLILLFSGWIFSLFEYFFLKTENKKLTEKLSEKEIEIKIYKSLSNDVETAKNDIENIIKTLNSIKEKLQLIENKLKKGE